MPQLPNALRHGPSEAKEVFAAASWSFVSNLLRLVGHVPRDASGRVRSAPKGGR
jgi:hypothetical protein